MALCLCFSGFKYVHLRFRFSGFGFSVEGLGLKVQHLKYKHSLVQQRGRVTEKHPPGHRIP